MCHVVAPRHNFIFKAAETYKMNKKHQDTMFNSNTSISLGICVIAKTPLSTAIPPLRLRTKQILPGPRSSNVQIQRQAVQNVRIPKMFSMVRPLEYDLS